MVMSADGKAVIGGTEAGIGSADDQRLMRELRVHADVILAGAGTLRATGISPRLGLPELEALREARGKPRYAMSATISRTGDLPLDGIFFTATDFGSLVYLSAEADPAKRAAIAATGRPVVDLPTKDPISAMLKHMRGWLDARFLLLEGGPDLNAQFFAQGLVDEYFLTLGPVIVGGRDTVTTVAGEPQQGAAPVRLEQLHAIPNPETGEVYLRYRVNVPPA
jgi:riboflavin biosynthesis pyrimidine reductase